MSNNPDRCSRLRILHDQLTNEVKQLRGSVQRAQQEGVNTIESLNTIKSLQSALHSISLELQKCPPPQEEPTPSPEVAGSSLLRQVKSTLPAQRVRQWFPDADQGDDEPRIIDEINR